MSKYTRRQYITLILICVAEFCGALCYSIQAPFYPKEAEERGASSSQYGFVFGVYFLVIFLLSPICGTFLTYLGAKSVLNISIFTLGTASLFFGFLEYINEVTTFIAMSFTLRIVEGAGYAAFLTASGGIIANEFPDDVGSSFALIETFFGAGLIFGPFIGGALYEVGGFLFPFALLGSLLIVISLFAFLFLPGAKEESNITPSCKVTFNLLRQFPVIVASATIFAASLSIGFLQTNFEPHIRFLMLRPVQVGLLFTVNGITYTLAAPIWGRLSDKLLSPKHVCLIGTLLVCLGYLLIGPAPFLYFKLTIPICIIALALNGVGISAELVAAFAVLNKETLTMGLPNDISTKAIVSSIWSSSFAFGGFVGSSASGILCETIGFRWSSQIVLGIHLTVFFMLIVCVCIFHEKNLLPTKNFSRLIEEEENSELASKKTSYASFSSQYE